MLTLLPRTKLELAQMRNFNKKRLTCITCNLTSMLENEKIALTREEQDSIRYVIKVITKLLSVWPKTIKPIN